MKKIQARRLVRRVKRTALPTESRFGYLRLDKNENLALPRTALQKALSNISAEEMSSNPEYGGFYRRLAKKLGCSRDNLLLTAGSEGAIKLAFESYVDAGDKVILLSPLFAMCEVYARLCGAVCVKINYDMAQGAPVDKILAAIRPGVKLIVIANPNNPTGFLVDADDLARIARRAAKVGALLLVDEAYYYFSKATFFRAVPKHRNVILTRSFSKAFGLAAARLGFAYARRDIIEALRKWQPIYDVNGPSLALADYFLKREALVWKYARATEEGKRLLADELIRRGFRVHAREGNFLLVHVGRFVKPCEAALRRRKILVAGGFDFAPIKDCLRVTTGPVPLMRRFLREFFRVSDRLGFDGNRRAAARP